MVKSQLNKIAGTFREAIQIVITNELWTTSTVAVVIFSVLENTKTIWTQRRDVNHQPDLIDRALIPELPKEFHETLNGDRFLLFDSGVEEDDRLMIFAPVHSSASEDRYNVGRFKVYLEVFFQDLITHVSLNCRTIQCVYVLLPIKLVLLTKAVLRNQKIL